MKPRAFCFLLGFAILAFGSAVFGNTVDFDTATTFSVRRYDSEGITILSSSDYGEMGIWSPYDIDVRSTPPGPLLWANNGTSYAMSGGYPGDRKSGFYILSDQLFSLQSIDLAEAGWDYYLNVWHKYGDVDAVSFIGQRADGTTLETTFNLDWVIDGEGGQSDFQTFSFGPEWNDLRMVEAIPRGGRMNNWFFFDTVVFSKSDISNQPFYDSFITDWKGPDLPPPESLPDATSTLQLAGIAAVILGFLRWFSFLSRLSDRGALL